MIVRRFFEPLLAHNSYLIGCPASGEALVIDATRDLVRYVEAAESEGLRIAHVTETHIHADYVSGSRELAARTGAALWLSTEGDAEWQYRFLAEGRPLVDGARLQVGGVRVDVAHTPGHTPEHLTFLLTDGGNDAPLAAVTGDFLFVGDVGRPDLLERVAGAGAAKGAANPLTADAAARTLHRSLSAFAARHHDWLQIWPGHGAGSSCGKGMSAVPHSTLGYERRFNWALQTMHEAEFTARVLAGQPDPPTYFATMKRMNRDGPPHLEGFRLPPRVDDADLESLLQRGALVIDTRAAAEYARGFRPGTLNLPLNSSFVTWAGWLVPHDVDVYLLASDENQSSLREGVRALALIGLDRVAGYFGGPALIPRATQPLAQIAQLTPTELEHRRHTNGPVVIDVRSESEWLEGHLPEAVHIPLGHLAERVTELPRGRPLVTQCAAGTRSAIAASVLAREGFTDVSNLAGGYHAWVEAGLPTQAAEKSQPEA